MTLVALMGWMQIAQTAVPLGLATVEMIKGWVKAAHGDMTDAQLNVSYGIIFDDASKRTSMAIADALGLTAK